MKNTICFLLIILAFSVFAGCASTNKPETAYNYRPLTVEVTKIAEQVRRADGLFQQGEYRLASKIYGQLLEENGSENGAFETALQTNICLCYLELGERENFKDCSQRLIDASRNLPYLSRETQLVLQLNNYLAGNGGKGKDLRIESRITDGLSEVFQEVR
jgi:tetratricopeptide (TPR) repeat protein